ncbi:putative quinic acid utilization activator, partial [Triangularia verruculosa]
MGSKRNIRETEGLSSIAPATPDPASLHPTSGHQVAPVSAAKRQRVSRACDQCRAAREKCDGVQPQCFPCISQTRACTYNVSPKKRGVQTGYIRTLELTLGWIFENVTGAEDALGSALAREGSQAQAAVTGKDASGATRLHKKWGRSRVHKAIDRLLSGGATPVLDLDEASPSVDANDTDGLVDVGKNIAPEPPDAAPNSAHGPHLATLPDHVIPDAQNLRTMSQNYSPGPSLNTPIRIKLPPEHWRLLDIYFSYTHNWLPILEKQALFQTSYRYSKEGLLLVPTNPSSAAHAELWAVLALASFQSTASSQSSPGDTGGTTISHAQIYNTARGLIPSECEAFQINHARALLLLTLVNMARGNSTDASLLLGSAIRILLSLHAGQAASDISPIRAALMSCFMLETVLSVAYNQLPHLRAEDLASFPPLPESGLDQWEPWAPCEDFGSKTVDFRSSRSPSFCITTFNQLYTILLVVSQEVSERRRGAATESHRSSFAAQLQQTLSSETPFGDFVASRDCQSSSVPTAYIIRILYLWATIRVSGFSSGSSISLLTETLERYEELFNTFTIPPLLLTCIRSLANEEFLAASGEQDREQSTRLAQRYSVSEPANRSISVRAASQCIPMTTNQPNMEREQNDRVSPALSSVVSGSGLAPLSITTSSLYGAGHPRRMSSTYDQQFHHPPATGNLHGGFGPVMSYGVPNVGVDMQHSHPPIGYGGPDYDALLDDMAATDCTDSIEVDPQFMLNLGYGPGCDTTEIFRSRFNGYE